MSEVLEQPAPRGVVMPRLLAWCGALVLAMALWVRWWGVPWIGLDLRVYLAGARAVLAGEDLYAVGVSNDHGGILRFSYPPFAALAFVPLVWVGVAAGVVLAVTSLVAYAGSAAVTARAVGWGARGATALVLLGLALEPVQRTLLYGQVNLVLAALVLVDVFVVPSRGRGWLTGVAAGVKLTPAVFIVYYLVRRDWGSAARMVASFAGTVGLGWILLPGDSARYWLHGLGSMSQFGGEVVLWGNQSWTAVVQRGSQLHDVPSSLVHLVTLGLCGVTLVLAVVAARLQSEAGDRLAALVVVALAGLLVSPVSWTHHWVWAVPAIAVLVRRGWRVFAGLSIAGFFLPPMWALHERSNDQLGYTPVELLLSAAFVLWAVAVIATLLVDGLVAVRRERASGRAAEPTLDTADASGAPSCAETHV